MLASLQDSILRALLADDPAAALERARAAAPPEERAAMAHIDADGFRIASLLVKKLRFERLCRGDAENESWFSRDPRGFTQLFRDYHREVPPVEYFPREEAARFREWRARRAAP
jgi:hypothetical protein